MLKKIRVNLGRRSYGIFLKEKILNNFISLLRSATHSKRFVILSSEPIFKIYGEMVKETLGKSGLKFHVILIPDGEKHKNSKTLLFILGKLAQFNIQRDGCLLALGGGVVGDLGGLAASLYMRGIDYLQVPTTLLAQVDASIGGKTAVDFHGIKNLIGAFYQPKMVLIDPLVLKTLSDRQFKTGLAEVIKYGVIGDERLFEKIENNLPAILKKDPEILKSIIFSSCRIKSKIVSMDEKESGKRAWLNYGHTLGHALEAHFKYKTLTHGEAVAYGMWFSSKLSFRLGFCSASVMDRQRILLKKVGLFPRLPRFDPGAVLRKMFLDKKARNGQILFILTRKIGLVTIQKNIPRQIILSALNQLQAEASES